MVSKSILLRGLLTISVISGVIIMVTLLMTHIRGLLTLLIPSHEPPSKGSLRVLSGFFTGSTTVQLLLMI